ncbi:MAG: sulfotransferase [Rhodobacteraceae bacterium]|nr:sulfotransferase [Paracoccaceae bacterium]
MFEQPRFIGIGQMKAATGWLYSHLSTHPDVWMPIKKELHFFNSGFHFGSTRRMFRAFLMEQAEDTLFADELISSSRLWRNQICGQDQTEALKDRLQCDFHFFSRALLSAEAMNLEHSSRGKTPDSRLVQRDFAWYSSLFPEDWGLTGEITPAYATLERGDLLRIRRTFPSTKFILNLRNPVSRAMSHLNHMLRSKDDGADPADKAVQMRTLDTTPDIIRKSRVTGLRTTWFDLFTEDRLLVNFFDDIVAHPDTVLTKVAGFLGIAPDRFQQPADHNPKSQYQKFDIHPEVKTRLEEILHKEVVEFDTIRNSTRYGRWRRRGRTNET